MDSYDCNGAQEYRLRFETWDGTYLAISIARGEFGIFFAQSRDMNYL